MHSRQSRVEQFYSVDEVAGLLGVSRETVYRLLKRWKKTEGREGLGPVVRIGARTRLAAGVVNGYLKACEV